MTHGSANITLLPIKMTRSSEKASESSSKAHGNRKPPSNTNSTKRRGAGVYECLGLVSLAIAVLHDASPALYTSMQPLLSRHEEDITRDFVVVVVVGAMMLVVMTALMGVCRIVLAPYFSDTTILQAVSHHADKKCAKRLLTRAVSSSGSNLSKLSSVWKSTSHLVLFNKSSSSSECHTTTLSASECFVSLQLIEKLSLVDVTRVFEYAVIDNNKKETSMENPALTQVLEAMNRRAVVRDTQGPDVQPATVGIDALLLCAALRIFAEWRLLRQVPKSFHKGYQMGMNLGRRDLIQNIGKIETVVHRYLQQQQQQQDGVTTSPSLEQLLQYELSQNVHSSLPKLNNESAAMGLLWAKRQVDYQACIYANLLDESKKFKDAHASIKAAYKQVFDPYHGWWIQQMFTQSSRSAPPAHEIYKLLSKDVMDTTSTFSTDETVPSWSESSCSSFDESNNSDVTQHVDSSFDKDSAAEPSVECQFLGGDLMDKATRSLSSEWNKFIESTLAFFQGRPPRLTTHVMEQHDSRANLRRQVDRRSAFAALEPVDPIQKTAHEHIQVFLATTQPMIHEISTLLETLNMNDPTKV